MGVFVGGPSPTSLDFAGVAAAMRPTLYEAFTAHVQVWDPNRDDLPVIGNRYDPFGDTGGKAEATLVFDSNANGALVQPIRSPGRIDVGDQPNALLGVRFQVKRIPTETDTVLRGGLLLRVLDGGESPDLVGRAFALQEAVDSSIAWGRIWDAVVVTGG